MTEENKHGIAGEAHDLVYGARASTYGHPRLDFNIIASVWTGLLQDVLKDGKQLDAYRVALMMTGLKLARLVKSPDHRDSRVDTIGYMLTMERLDEPEVPFEQKVKPKFLGKLSFAAGDRLEDKNEDEWTFLSNGHLSRELGYEEYWEAIIKLYTPLYVKSGAHKGATILENGSVVWG